MLLSFWVLSSLLALSTQAITVTENSTCVRDCGGDRTSSSDLVCLDDDYQNTDKGTTIRNCLLCESTSTRYNTSTDNDLYWFLANLKFTLEWCLFDNPTGTTGMPSCETSCQPLKPILLKLWSGPPRVEAYYYCDMTGGLFGQHVDACASCLQTTTGSVVLGNFLQTMQAGCESKANASDGETIPLQRSLFNTSLVTTSDDSRGLSTSAAAGIGVGGGIVVLGVIAGLIWVQVRRRRRSALLAEMGGPEIKLPLSDAITSRSDLMLTQLESTPVVEADGRQIRPMRAELPDWKME